MFWASLLSRTYSQKMKLLNIINVHLMNVKGIAVLFSVGFVLFGVEVEVAVC